MKIIDRFDKYMKYRHLNDNRVTVQLGLTNGVIAQSRRPNRDLSRKVIEKIERFYTDLNIDWLITGNGDMIKTEQEKPITSGGVHVTTTEKLIEEISRHREQVDRLLSILEKQNDYINKLLDSKL